MCSINMDDKETCEVRWNEVKELDMDMNMERIKNTALSTVK